VADCVRVPRGRCEKNQDIPQEQAQAPKGSQSVGGRGGQCCHRYSEEFAEILNDMNYSIDYGKERVE
jgi:hypothetical protein